MSQVSGSGDAFTRQAAPASAWKRRWSGSMIGILSSMVRTAPSAGFRSGSGKGAEISVRPNLGRESEQRGGERESRGVFQLEGAFPASGFLGSGESDSCFVRTEALRAFLPSDEADRPRVAERPGRKGDQPERDRPDVPEFQRVGA